MEEKHYTTNLPDGTYVNPETADREPGHWSGLEPKDDGLPEGQQRIIPPSIVPEQYIHRR